MRGWTLDGETLSCVHCSDGDRQCDPSVEHHKLNPAYTSWDWNTAAYDQLVRHSRRSGDLLKMGLRFFLVASQPPRVVSVTKHWSTLDPGLAGKHQMVYHVFKMQIQRRVDDSGVLF